MTAQGKLAKLVRDHYDRLFRAALFMCGNPEAAEDLVQDTYLAAADALGSFEGRSSVYTWLYGIMRNKFRDWLRAKKRHVSLHEMGDGADGAELLSSDEPGVHDELIRRETGQIVRGALDELPPHHRDVLVLRYLERMSYQEIAGELECSIGTVKSRIHYALRRIGQKFEERRELLL